MPTKKVTRRWLYNSFLVILIFLSLLIIAFSIAVRSYYYNSVLTIVRNTASVQNASLVNYSEDNTVDFSSSVRKMVEDFDEKDHMELMAIDKSGTVIITSSGFSPTEQLDMPDYTQALSSPSRDSFAYDTLNGESVLAYTLLAPTVDDSNISALRYVVSLTAVKRQILYADCRCGRGGRCYHLFCHPVQLLFYQFHHQPHRPGAQDCPANFQGRFFCPPEKDDRRRDWRTVRCHQCNGSGIAGKRKDEKRLHLLGFPRAAHPARPPSKVGQKR